MLTRMKREDVIAIGSRNRAGYLLEQLGYTVGVARLEGDDLARHLPGRYLDEVEACGALVSEARKDKVLAAVESKGSTQNVNNVLRQAKEWRRKVTARGRKSRKLGYDVPDVLVSLDGAKTVPAVTAQMEAMLKLLAANADNLPGTDLKPDIDAGKGILAALKTTDADQEVKHLKHLSDKVSEYYYQKGLLFIGLKVINEAGHELHYRSPGNAAKYNMSILYRSAGKRKQPPEGAARK